MNTPEQPKDPLAAWFLGPKAEHADEWTKLISYIFQDYIHWRRNYFPEDPIVVDRVTRRKHEHWFDKLTNEMDTVLNSLKAHYPFYSPRYISHMLSEQTLPSVLGYFAGMLYNPNNVTSEAAPITVQYELQVGHMIAQMLGYNPAESWGHICSGGTLGNFEALWVAQLSQLRGLVVQDYCRQRQIAFHVRTPSHKPSGGLVDIRSLAPQAILSLRPNELLQMQNRLFRFLLEDQQRNETVIDDYFSFTKTSEYNAFEQGAIRVYSKISVEPRIFVSEAAHYCVKKAAVLLGYGHNSIVPIPVDKSFRLNHRELEKALNAIGEQEYATMVIGICGTTEEGAIDPLHEIVEVRNRYSSEKNRSFWFHVDAAWGGYIRTLFNGEEFEGINTRDLGVENMNRIRDILKIQEEHVYPEAIGQAPNRTSINWNQFSNYKAVLSCQESDSVKIDPHKMGYIPYPAGLIAYKSTFTTELIKQRAQYINDDTGVPSKEKVLAKPVVSSVGPFIIEGSKPGASAAACYLAHKTIPLTLRGHGKLIRTTLLNAQRFYHHLSFHRNLFGYIESQQLKVKGKNTKPFTFVPLAHPDCNVVCFVAIPMNWNDGSLGSTDFSVDELNALNEFIYRNMSIENDHGSEHKLPYLQEYFISRTVLSIEQYSIESVSTFLDTLKISSDEYKAKGIFILRSTFMNPYHYKAKSAGKDYVFDYLCHLHKVCREYFNSDSE